MSGATFFVPVCGENGNYGRKIGKIIPYYGNTMDCLRGVAHLCSVTNTEGYGNNNDGQ